MTADDDAEWGMLPGTSLEDILERGDALLAGAEIPFEEAVLAAMFVIRRAYSIADAELLHEALGLSENREPCVFDTETGEFVTVASLEGAA